MPRDEFRFKKFCIRQDRCAMKVGTDGVLLGSWASLRAGARVLDIGTGTGLLALMAAQRGAGMADAVELVPDAAIQARENIQASPWKEKIRVHTCDISTYQSDDAYDFIWSNPPFYENTLLPPDAERSVARNTQTLSCGLLAHSVARLLSARGTFSVVYPYDAAARLETALAGEGLYPVKKTLVQTRAGKPPRRILMEFSREIIPTSETTLTLTDNNGSCTPEYSALTAEFYLEKTSE